MADAHVLECDGDGDGVSICKILHSELPCKSPTLFVGRLFISELYVLPVSRSRYGFIVSQPPMRVRLAEHKEERR